MSLIICIFVSCCRWLHRDSLQAQGGGCSRPTDCCRHWNGFHQISGRTHILLASLNWLWPNAVVQHGTRAKNMPWRWGHEAWSTRGAHFRLVQLILFFPFWRYWNNIFPVILHFFASTYPMLSVNCTCVFSGYDLNVKNLVNVNYSTNATCDSAM